MHPDSSLSYPLGIFFCSILCQPIYQFYLAYPFLISSGARQSNEGLRNSRCTLTHPSAIGWGFFLFNSVSTNLLVLFGLPFLISSGYRESNQGLRNSRCTLTHSSATRWGFFFVQSCVNQSISSM